jgi:protein TonB
MSGREGGSRLAPFTLSAILHAAIATLLFSTLKERRPVALPPMYRVEIVAAPPGERAIGEVSPSQAATTTSVTQPTATQSTVKEMPLPKAKPAQKIPARATPTEGKVSPSPKVSAPTEAKVTPQPKTAAPKAGGGPTGGKGTDVASVRSDGIEFPFPGYLNNIVRQIAINFKPRNPAARLKAEVRFLIHRDGSVSDLSFVRRSGNFSFDPKHRGRLKRLPARADSAHCRPDFLTTCFPSSSASTPSS